MIGTNNVGKSTICEALDLVLGPDRLGREHPIEEFDFYNAEYLSKPSGEGEERKPITIRIEVILIELTAEVENKCGSNLEFWRVSDKTLLKSGEVNAANPPDVGTCLRLEMIGSYDIEEDEFEAKTYFSHSPNAENGELTAVPKHVKRLFDLCTQNERNAGKNRRFWFKAGKAPSDCAAS